MTNRSNAKGSKIKTVKHMYVYSNHDEHLHEYNDSQQMYKVLSIIGNVQNVINKYNLKKSVIDF